MSSDSAALIRFLELLESARPTDVRAVASALPEAELLAAIDAVEGQIGLALREYVLTEGPSAALIALARHAIVTSGPSAKNTVHRILTRFDPEADAAFFDFEISGKRHRRARRAILRDRKGPDGRAVIPPRVKQLVLDALAAEAHNGGEPSRRLMAEVAYADDPDLVKALLPHARLLTTDEAARVIMTLDTYGYRAEAKRHRGLWAGRGSAFRILGIRRFSRLPSMIKPDRRFHLTPAFSAQEITLRHYYQPGFWSPRPTPERQGLLSLRSSAQVALQTGEVSPAEILENATPAALTLSLAFSKNPGSLPPAERRVTEDMRTLISQFTTEELGDDPGRWVRAIRRVGRYEESLAALLACPESDTEERGASDFNYLLSDDVDVRSILIALAPRETAGRFLVAERMEAVITAIARSVPLSPALVDHIIERGTITQQGRLAFNPATPDAILTRLIDTTKNTDIMFAIMDRAEVGQEILERAYATAPRYRKYRSWIASWAPHTPGAVLTALRCWAHDPAWVLSVLRETIEKFDEPGRIAAYVMLAEMVGVEAVWAVELDRAGSLEAMAEYVRASMASGTAEPLIEAARASPIEDQTEVRRLRTSRTEEQLGLIPDAFVDLIRSRLDGRTDRWLELLELFRSRPDVSDEELIAAFPVSPA